MTRKGLPIWSPIDAERLECGGERPPGNRDFPRGREESRGHEGKSGFPGWSRRRRFGMPCARRQLKMGIASWTRAGEP